MSLKALRQKKADALAKANAIFEAASTAGRDLTEAERAEYDGLMGEKGTIATLNGDIKRAEALLEEQRSTPASQVIEVGQNRAETKPWRSFGEQMIALAKSTIAVTTGRADRADPRIVANAMTLCSMLLESIREQFGAVIVHDG